MKLTPLQKRAERRSRNKTMVDMNLVSLIDVFTILIFFLLSNAGPAHDVKALQALVLQLKSQFPDKLDASVLAEPNTPYDTLVQVMDAVRGTMTAQGPRIIRTELFPNISIGDAPVVKR